MSRLLQEINQSSEWLVKAFKAINLNLDYSLHSVRYIDNMLDAQWENGVPKPNGILAENTGPKLFAISAYLGEVVIRNTPGTQWVVNDEDPNGEINIKIVSATKTEMFPGQRLTKRLHQSDPEGLYGYIQQAIEHVMCDPNVIKNDSSKPWWKIW